MLEYAVRPYQTPNSQGKIIIPSTPGSTTARATITWGAQTQLPSASPGINVVCCSDELNELSRQGEVVRITQPDNSDNYVDVFRANSLKLNKKSKQNCQGPFDQELSADFGLDDTGDTDLGISFDPADGSGQQNCGVTWKLNNNTASP